MIIKILLILSLSSSNNLFCNATFQYKDGPLWHTAFVDQGQWTYSLDIPSPSEIVCATAATQLQWPKLLRYVDNRCYLSSLERLPAQDYTIPPNHLVAKTRIPPTSCELQDGTVVEHGPGYILLDDCSFANCTDGNLVILWQPPAGVSTNPCFGTTMTCFLDETQNINCTCNTNFFPITGDVLNGGCDDCGGNTFCCARQYGYYTITPSPVTPGCSVNPGEFTTVNGEKLIKVASSTSATVRRANCQAKCSEPWTPSGSASSTLPALFAAFGTTYYTFIGIVEDTCGGYQDIFGNPVTYSYVNQFSPYDCISVDDSQGNNYLGDRCTFDQATFCKKVHP